MTKATIISVWNLKGGVGKSCTAVNLATYLCASQGCKCLLVDIDPQANATQGLSEKPFGMDRPSIRDVLLRCEKKNLSVEQVLVTTAVPDLMLAPSALNLSEAEYKLVHQVSREYILRTHLHTAVRSFDYIIIDCPPSLGLLSLNALATSDKVIVPCETQFLAIQGLRLVTDVADMVRERLNPNLTILGVLPTKFYVLSKANRVALDYVQQLKGLRTFQTVIPRDVKAEEAPSHGKPLLLYAPESRAAKRYKELAEEVNILCKN